MNLNKKLFFFFVLLLSISGCGGESSEGSPAAPSAPLQAPPSVVVSQDAPLLSTPVNTDRTVAARSLQKISFNYNVSSASKVMQDATAEVDLPDQNKTSVGTQRHRFRGH